jgi:phage portal protein BeeE
VKVWQKVLGHPDTEKRSLIPDEWAQFFGADYAPFLTQTWQPDREQKPSTATGAYRGNGPVFSLVMARMQVFAQARFAWTRFNGGMPGDPFGTQELSVLEKPWTGGTTGDLLARMEMHASLHGTAFIRRIRADRLSVLRPQWVTVVIGSNEEADHPSEAGDAEIIGYLYKPPNARGVILEPHELAMYAPLPDPDNNFLGMSWITPVLRDVAADDASNQHKRKFFENAATPNLAIKFDPTVGLAQVKEFKALMEAEHKGFANAYKTLYLGGGADPVVIGKDFKELDFAVTQGKGESRLASAAGVPPSWVGFSEGLQGSALNAGNFTAARRRFGDGTMHHLWQQAASSLAPLVRAPQGAALWYDTRGIPFMREDAKDAAEVQTSQATTITTLIRDGFTPESAIAAVRNNDWTLLKHTGLVSVQLQPPGALQIPTKEAPNGDD